MSVDILQTLNPTTVLLLRLIARSEWGHHFLEFYASCTCDVEPCIASLTHVFLSPTQPIAQPVGCSKKTPTDMRLRVLVKYWGQSEQVTSRAHSCG